MSPNQQVDVFGKVADETGKYQLVLRYVEVDRPIKGGGKAYDFYSLAWEVQHGDKWIEKAVISRADFQKGAQRRRWISNIQSFDPDTSHALLQIGEEGPRDLAGAMHVTYSWREWDVENNREIRVIRVCENPFEAFGIDKPAG